MVILAFIGASLIVGLLLYLPFFLWFRSRRRRGRSVSAESHVTRSGTMLVAAEIVVIISGLAVGVIAPDSWLGSFTQGAIGMLRWTFCVAVIVGTVEMVLRRRNVALQQKKPSEDAPVADEPSRLSWFRRRWKIATLRGVPLFIHASLPIGGLMAAFFAKAGLAEAMGYCLSFVALIAVHEFGHFAAARAMGLRVFSVDISGVGGSCRTQVPRGVKQTFVLYSAGLAAQAVLLLLTVATVAMLGMPRSAVGRSVVITFTAVNLVVAVINLVPGKIRDDLSTDGAILWELFLHVFFGRPHPLATLHALSPVFSPDTQLLSIDGMAPSGFTVGIELLNDDTTPMEFVIAMLETHVKLNRETAIASMLNVHNKGGLLIPLADRDHAEEVASAVMRDAREKGWPLTCRAVEALTF